MALLRSGAPDPRLAQPVAQAVHQGGHLSAFVGLVGGEPVLLLGERLHPMSRQRHHLDAEAGIDALQLGREQLHQPPRRAVGQRRADAQEKARPSTRWNTASKRRPPCPAAASRRQSASARSPRRGRSRPAR
jgi:hypothetical protein